MKRRHVLETMAAATLFASLSGCTGGGGASDGGDGATDTGGGSTDRPTEPSSDGGGSSICDHADFALWDAEVVDDSTVELVIRNQAGEGIQPVEVSVLRTDSETFSADVQDSTAVADGDEFSVEVEINGDLDSIYNIDLFYRDAEGNCSMGGTCPHQDAVCPTRVL